MKINKCKGKIGQTMVEYIIIVVLVAMAALTIFAVFSDTIRSKLAGGIQEMDSGANAQAAKDAAATSSQTYLQNLDGTR